MMKIIKLFLLIFLNVFFLYSQEFINPAGDKFDDSNIFELIEPVPDSLISKAIYQFGDSEWESELLIDCIGEKILSYYSWGEGLLDSTGNFLRFVKKYKPLLDINIDRTELKSRKWMFQFFNYYENLEYGLADSIKNNSKVIIKAVLSSSDYISNNEVGFKTSQFYFDSFFIGNYPEASQKLLQEKDLAQYDNHDLKLMRNEIYARYGYHFKKGGDMEKHFKKQTWYFPYLTDNSMLKLSWVEKKNVELIKKLEKSR